MEQLTPEEQNIVCKALAAYAPRANAEDAAIAKRVYNRLAAGTTVGPVRAEVIPSADDDPNLAIPRNDQLPSIAAEGSTAQD